MGTVEGSSKSILTNGSVTFSGLPAGTHSVALSGIASNCTVSSANPMTVTVPAGGVGQSDFAISCVALPWTVTIDWGDGGSDTFPMETEGAISGSHSYHDLLLATHKLTITVVDAHSASGTASKTVDVVASLP